jgi:hypothetical protein
LIDGLVVVVLLGCGLVGFQPVFGDLSWLAPALGGLVAGLAVAWLGAWRRWPTGLVGLATVIAYLLAGASALPRDALGGVIPSAQTLQQLLLGAVTVWRDFLTAVPPVGAFPELAVAPYLTALLGAVLAGSAAWRAKRPAWTLLPVAIVVTGVIAWGADTAFQPVIQGLLLVLVALTWLAWRRRSRIAASGLATTGSEGLSRRWVRPLRDSVMVLGAAVLVAGAVGWTQLDDLPRRVARQQITPPLNLRAWASPLMDFRSLVELPTDTALFTVDNWPTDSGQEPNYRLRLGVMDSYDGLVYNASGSYFRVGPELTFSATEPVGNPISVTIEVDDYDGVWVPGLSQLTEVQFAGDRALALTEDLYHNAEADALIDPAGLTQGDRYRVDSIVPTLTAEDVDGHSPGLPGGQRMPALPAGAVSDVVTDQANRMVGEARDDVSRIEAIVTHLSARGWFSHGLEGQTKSLPGHSSGRIADLLADPDLMIGDDEQYAVAAALMLRQLGLPARVVMGFYPDEKSIPIKDGTWTVTSNDVHAWIEVPFEGLGWVVYNPVPPEDQEPIEQTPQSRTDPKPQILQPPPPPDDLEAEEPENVPEERNEEENNLYGINWQLVLRIVALIGLPLLVLLGPPLLILALKWRRRRQRGLAQDPAERVVGGWQEVLDRAADLGAVVPRGATRSQTAQSVGRYVADLNAHRPGPAETAAPAHGVDGQASGNPVARLSQVAPASAQAVAPDGEQSAWPQRLGRLAAQADEAVFAAQLPTAQQAQSYWDEAGNVSQDLLLVVGPGRRWRTRLALTSLRRRPKPTVEVDKPR